MFLSNSPLKFLMAVAAVKFARYRKKWHTPCLYSGFHQFRIAELDLLLYCLVSEKQVTVTLSSEALKLKFHKAIELQGLVPFTFTSRKCSCVWMQRHVLM